MAVSLAPSDDYESLLRALGLTSGQLTEALGASNTERRICVQKHCAKSAPGYYAYNGMLTSLSGQLCGTKEWQREDPMSMPLLLNHGLRVALTVSSGDRFTGLRIAGSQPRTKNPKGELTKELARMNAVTSDEGGLFEVPEENKEPLHKLLAALDNFKFWVALVFFDRQDLEVRCEVSQPADFNNRGQVSSFRRRIILPPYALSGDDFPDDEDPNEGFGPIEFDVPRR